MRNFLRLRAWWLVILIPMLVLLKPYLQTGVPFTHDGENHLARFANYKIALREGQFPPRFAPNLMNHYGYPVFNYNYPLPNLLSLPLSAMGVHYEITFKILMSAGVVVGAAGVWAWLKACGFARSNRLFALAAFLTLPFMANLVYVRGSIGEMWALALFPWLLWCTKMVKREHRVPWLVTVPLIAGFFLSHNVSVLFGSVLWFLYALQKFGRTKKYWQRFLGPVLLSGLMSLWFWLPALAEQSLVVVGEDGLASQFTQHFVQPLQLFTAPLQFGFSYEGPVDTLSFSAGITLLASLAIMTLWLLKRKSRGVMKESRWLWFFVLISWMLLLLQTSYTVPIWKAVPLAHFIQFPWRLSLFFGVMALPLVASAFSLSRGVRLVLWATVVCQIMAVWHLHPAFLLHKQALEYDLFPQSTSTANENRAVEFNYVDIGDWQPAPSVASGSATIAVTHWNGTSRAYQIHATEESLIVEPTMYFAGWETSLNGKVVQYVPRVETEGRIGYRVAAGEYDVETRFTQNTWPRLIGNTVSALALGLWGWLVWKEKHIFFGKSSRS